MKCDRYALEFDNMEELKKNYDLILAISGVLRLKSYFNQLNDQKDLYQSELWLFNIFINKISIYLNNYIGICEMNDRQLLINDLLLRKQEIFLIKKESNPLSGSDQAYFVKVEYILEEIFDNNDLGMICKFSKVNKLLKLLIGNIKEKIVFDDY